MSALMQRYCTAVLLSFSAQRDPNSLIGVALYDHILGITLITRSHNLDPVRAGRKQHLNLTRSGCISSTVIASIDVYSCIGRLYLYSQVHIRRRCFSLIGAFRWGSLPVGLWWRWGLIIPLLRRPVWTTGILVFVFTLGKHHLPFVDYVLTRYHLILDVVVLSRYDLHRYDVGSETWSTKNDAMFSR